MFSSLALVFYKDMASAKALAEEEETEELACEFDKNNYQVTILVVIFRL